MTANIPGQQPIGDDISKDASVGANEPEASNNTSETTQLQALEADAVDASSDSPTKGDLSKNIGGGVVPPNQASVGSAGSPPSPKVRMTKDEKLQHYLSQEIIEQGEFLKWKERLMLKKVFDRLHLAYYNRWRTEANKSFRLSAGFKRRRQNPKAG